MVEINPYEPPEIVGVGNQNITERSLLVWLQVIDILFVIARITLAIGFGVLIAILCALLMAYVFQNYVNDYVFIILFFGTGLAAGLFDYRRSRERLSLWRDKLKQWFFQYFDVANQNIATSDENLK